MTHTALSVIMYLCDWTEWTCALCGHCYWCCFVYRSNRQVMCKQLVNVSHHFTVTLFILYMHRCHSRTMECLEIIIIMSYTLCQFPPLSLD